MSKVERDDKFYMTLVTIQVEDCLFRVPRQLLESQSRIFRDMFSLPVPRDAEGSSDDNPIRLDGITKEEFKRFLEVLFTGVYEETTTQISESIFDIWFPVVKLARMWECDTLYKYAVKKMPYGQIGKTPAEKVGLAVRYEIQPWLLPGVNELAQRTEPLGNDDLAYLGPELTLKVASVRESLSVRYGGNGRYTSARLVSGSRDASTVDFTPAVKRVFQLSDDDVNDEMDMVNAPQRGSKRKASSFGLEY